MPPISSVQVLAQPADGGARADPAIRYPLKFAVQREDPRLEEMLLDRLAGREKRFFGVTAAGCTVLQLAAREDLAELAHRRGLLLIDDLGSGTLIDTAQFGLEREPRVQERIVAGADLVCFSGDKLLGGPQAGYIVGRRELIERLKQQPLLRALRVDKVTLAGIEATLRRYQRGDVLLHLPVWRSISMPLEEIEARAQAWKEQLGLGEEVASVRDARSTVGGGSLPGMTLPTRALALKVEAPDACVRRLREGEPPVVARIEDDRVLFDPRTVMPHEDGQLVRAIRAALRG